MLDRVARFERLRSHVTGEMLDLSSPSCYELRKFLESSELNPTTVGYG